MGQNHGSSGNGQKRVGLVAEINLSDERVGI